MLVHLIHFELKLTDMDRTDCQSIFEGSNRNFLELRDQIENNK